MAMEEMGIPWIPLLPKHVGLGFIHKMLAGYGEVLQASFVTNRPWNLQLLNTALNTLPLLENMWVWKGKRNYLGEVETT